MQPSGYDTNDPGAVRRAMSQHDIGAPTSNIIWRHNSKSGALRPFLSQPYVSAAGTHFSQPWLSCVPSTSSHTWPGEKCGVKVLLDSNQLSPVSRGACASATQTLLGRTARTVYHTTIRPTTFTRSGVVLIVWEKHTRTTTGFSRFSLWLIFTEEVTCRKTLSS